jgi:hypothetical protein
MKFLRKLISPKVCIALAIALVIGQFISPEVAMAVTESNENETLKAFAQLFSVFVNIFTFISLVFLNYGGDLVGTEFLTGPDPMGAIRPMWVIIRNITNVLFVLILLFLAFSNLFSSLGGEGGNWTIKEKLPKVILALIAINFSLLGFRVVIDAVHVGTITIFSIPDSTLQAKGSDNLQDMLIQRVEVDVDKDVVKYVPFYEVMNDLMCGTDKGNEWHSEGRKFKINEEGLPEIDASGEYKALNESLSDDCFFGIDPTDMRVGSPKSRSAHNLFLAFGIQFQKLQNLPSLAARLNDWSDVFTSVLFVSILSLAQVVALAAVFIALLLRIVVLWVAMVFSPALIAAAIMGFGGGKEGTIGTQVITNLIMPLKIAAAFSVCFLMMDTMMNVGESGVGNLIRTGASISTFGATGYGLLWSIATIVVFWKAAFWALEGSAGEDIANTIKGGAETTGKFLAKAGTVDREFFPMPGMDGENKVALSTLYKAGTSGVVTAHNKAMEKDSRSFTDHVGLTDPAKTGNVEKIRDAIGNMGTAGQVMASEFVDFIKEHPIEGLDKKNATDTYGRFGNALKTQIENHGGGEAGFIAGMTKDIQGQKEYLETLRSKGVLSTITKEEIEDLDGKGSGKSSTTAAVADQNKPFVTTTIVNGVKESKVVYYNVDRLKGNGDDVKGDVEAIKALLSGAGITTDELKDIEGAELVKFSSKIENIDGWGSVDKADIEKALKEIQTPPQ